MRSLTRETRNDEGKTPRGRAGGDDTGEGLFEAIDASNHTPKWTPRASTVVFRPSLPGSSSSSRVLLKDGERRGEVVVRFVRDLRNLLVLALPPASPDPYS